jgi:hypothetical protein
MFLGPFGLLVIPEELKGFFEVVGADDRSVPTDQRREAFFLIAAEIPGILEQQPASAFEGDSLLGRVLASQFAANRIHSLIQVLDDMESVKQNLGIRGVPPNQTGVRRPHTFAVCPQPRFQTSTGVAPVLSSRPPHCLTGDENHQVS